MATVVAVAASCNQDTFEKRVFNLSDDLSSRLIKVKFKQCRRKIQDKIRQT